MSFTLIELRILADLADGRTLASIAGDVGLGQPAVSKLVRAIERKASLPLLERQGRRLCLTPAGFELARAAQGVLGRERAFEQTLADLRAGRAGPLRLLATSTTGNYVLPTVIGEFLQIVPDAQVELRLLPPGVIREVLLREPYDLAVFGTAPRTVQPAELQFERLYDEAVTLFVGRESPLLRSARLGWDALRDETLIGPLTEPPWAEILVELKQQGLAPRRQIDLHGPEGVKRLVAAGGGVGLLFDTALRQELQNGQLCALPLDARLPLRTTCLVRRQHARLSPVAQQFRAFLKDRLCDPVVAKERAHA